jgi:hypothetical protein
MGEILQVLKSTTSVLDKMYEAARASRKHGGKPGVELARLREKQMVELSRKSLAAIRKIEETKVDPHALRVYVDNLKTYNEEAGPAQEERDKQIRERSIEILKEYGITTYRIGEEEKSSSTKKSKSKQPTSPKGYQ